MLQRKVTEDPAKRERRTVFTTLLWFLFISELFLLSIALLVGRGCGYKITFISFGCLGGIIGAGILLFIFITAIIDYVIEKKKVK
jgi:hypothetical protein